MSILQQSKDTVRREIEQTLAESRSRINRNAFIIALILALLSLCLGVFWQKNQLLQTALFPIVTFAAVFYISQRHFRATVCGQLEAALPVLDKEPRSACDYAARAEMFADWGQLEMAAGDYEKSIELDPEDCATLFSYASFLFYVEKQPEKAGFLLDRVLKLNDLYREDAFFLKGKILEKTDPEQALVCFDKAIELDAGDDEFQCSRVRLLLDFGRIQEAESSLRQFSNKMKNETIQLHETWSLYFLKSGSPALGLPSINRAVKLDRNNPEGYKIRADIYDSLGNTEKAAQDREKAAALERAENQP